MSIIILTIGLHIAIYIYSIGYGARVPLEGVPYFLHLSAITSIALSLGSVFIFWVQSGLTRYVRHIGQNISGVFGDDLNKILTRLHVRGKTLGIFLVILGLVGIAIAPRTNSAFEVFFSASATMLFGGWLANGGFPKEESEVKRKARATIRTNSWALYVLLVIGIVYVIFSNNLKRYLSITRYGGGIEIAIEMDDGSVIQSVGLFLRSRDSVIVWDPDSGHFMEYELLDIYGITYSPLPNELLPRPLLASEIIVQQ